MTLAHTQPSASGHTTPDTLLSYAANAVSLPPDRYGIMLGRAIKILEHLERDGSPLKGRIHTTYLQGSAAIGATILSSAREGGYDIDIVIELSEAFRSPKETLDMLFEAIRGEPGHKNYNRTERRSRCVTVRFSDAMHIDFTPSELIDANDPRRSYIFQSDPKGPQNVGDVVITNSYAFVNHYNDKCAGGDLSLRLQVQRALEQYPITGDTSTNMRDLNPSKDCIETGSVPAVTAALQLLKRYRNRLWANRSTRMPPSTLLSCLAIDVVNPGRGVLYHLIELAKHTHRELSTAAEMRKLIHVCNPKCSEDVFTDRWPADFGCQSEFIVDLAFLLEKLDEFERTDNLRVRLNIIKDIFGEDISCRVEKNYCSGMGNTIRSRCHTIGSFGGIVAAPSLAVATPVREHMFYGGNVHRDSSPILQLPAYRGVRSFGDQISSMKDMWPLLICTTGSRCGIARWIGPLRGIDRVFLVEILYSHPNAAGILPLPFPMVTVVKPELVPKRNCDGRLELPHVYTDTSNYSRSPLCLFDPRLGEWDPSMLINYTTVPWTVRWLACYEIWEATGRWVGGGTH